MTHDKSICEFCQAVAVMDKITDLIDTLPAFGVTLFDDAIGNVYSAADDASAVLRCWAADRESAHEHEA